MRHRIWLGLLLALSAGPVWATDPNVPSSVITQATGASTGSGSSGPLFPAQPVGSGNPLYVRSSTLALDSSIQALETILQAPLTFNLPANAATATNQATANGYLLTLSNFTTSASTSALQSTGNGFLSTLATASASQATGAKQDTGNTSLATIATNSGTQATAANQATQITAEQTTATQTTAINSKLGSPLPLPTGASTAANQTNVQSAPGTPQTVALTIQGNASGVPVPVSGTVTITPAGTQNVTGTGTAGSPAAGVVTVQGNASGTPFPTIPPKLTAYGILPVTASSVALSTITVSPNSAAWSSTYPSGYVAIRNSILSAGVVYVCWLGGTCSATVGDPIAVGQSASRNVGNGITPTLFAASTASVTGAE